MLLDERWERSLDRHIAEAYLDTKAEVIRRGFAAEIDWQHDASLRQLDESTFMRESAWVILSAGLSERVVGSRFSSISNAFDGFESAKGIWLDRKERRANALAEFRFAPKIDAILTVIGYLARTGIDHVRIELERRPIEFLRRFPYFGPATSRHLAKNLGVVVAKPDRHLVRIAKQLGFENVSTMCAVISSFVGDPVNVVDIVIWRYATFTRHHAADFCTRVEAISNQPALY